MSVSARLRLASIVAFIYWLGHTAGAPWTPARGPAETAALDVLRSLRIDVEGFSRTYWNFYVGFGVAISGFLLVQAVLLWQLATLAKADAFRLRPIIAPLLVGFCANAIIAWIYFFPVPAVLAAGIAACLAGAWLGTGPRATRNVPQTPAG